VDIFPVTQRKKEKEKNFAMRNNNAREWMHREAARGVITTM